MLKTLAIFGCCLHKQRVFERSMSGTHLFLPSWLNLFPRDFILPFQLTVCLYYSHFIFCLMLEEMGFCHFSSPSLLISENELPKPVVPERRGLWCCFRIVLAICLFSVTLFPARRCSFCVSVEQKSPDTRGNHVACAWWTHFLVRAEGSWHLLWFIQIHAHMTMSKWFCKCGNCIHKQRIRCAFLTR